MSRYVLLLLLNLPFIIAAIVSGLTKYKMNKISGRRFYAYALFWLLILTGLVFAEPTYNWLFSNQLTNTEPLSLFDVIQITAIVIVLYMANQTRSRVDSLERKVRDLHQELSIRLSDSDSIETKKL